MATRHQLALDVLDTSHVTVLKLSDASIYAGMLPVDCPRLEILAPGFAVPVFITNNLEKPGFIVTLTAHDLGMQPQVAEAKRALPDGVWEITYAVSPHELTQVRYYHLRAVSLLNDYYRELCKIQLQTCELSTDQKLRLQQLHDVYLYVQAAKAQTEYCHSSVRGAELLAYARKLLTRLSTSPCPTC